MLSKEERRLSRLQRQDSVIELVENEVLALSHDDSLSDRELRKQFDSRNIFASVAGESFADRLREGFIMRDI